jgi:hypothetical protein
LLDLDVLERLWIWLLPLGPAQKDVSQSPDLASVLIFLFSLRSSSLRSARWFGFPVNFVSSALVSCSELGCRPSFLCVQFGSARSHGSGSRISLSAVDFSSARCVQGSSPSCLLSSRCRNEACLDLHSSRSMLPLRSGHRRI